MDDSGCIYVGSIKGDQAYALADDMGGCGGVPIPPWTLFDILADGASAFKAAVVTVAVYFYAAASAYSNDSVVWKQATDEPPDGQYQYWEAYRDKNTVYVGRGLSIIDASFRVAMGLDIMCVNQDAARWLLNINRYRNAVGPEAHRGGYSHYHPHRHTHTHIWYYGGES